MRRLLRLLPVVALVTVAATACGTSGSGGAGGAGTGGGDQMSLKLADDFPPTDPLNTFLNNFAVDVTKRTSGNVKVTLFKGGQLGSEGDIVRGVANGTIAMSMVGVTGYPPLDAFFTPYAVRSQHQLDLIIEQKMLQKYIDQFETNQHAHLLGTLYVSPRQMTSKKPINSVQDVQGLKLRVPKINSEVKVFTAMGAQPTILAFTEVYTALQNGAADAQENPVSTILSAKFYEVQPYLDLTNHGIQPQWVFVNSDVWAKLSQSQKDAVTEAFTAMAKDQRKAAEGSFKKDVETLQSKGMKVVNPPYDDFRAKVYDSTVRPLLAELWGADLVDKIQNLPAS